MKNKNSNKGFIRNGFALAAMMKGGSGVHQDKRLKRTNRKSWKKEIANG